MISHRHQCVFTHIPKTAGKAVLSAFGLPELGRQYDGALDYIACPYGHTPLRRHRQHRQHRGYFKFAFVRNPWDRLVSAFFYLDGGGCNEDDEAYRARRLTRYGSAFDAFVLDLPAHLDAPHFRPQVHWISDRWGRLLTDFIGRYETLDRDFGVVAERLGLQSGLPLINPSSHRPYREHYTAETRAIVAAHYRADIDAFGYEF